MNGDELAFKSLYLKLCPIVRSKVYRMTADMELSEEITQRVFIKFWQKVKGLSIEESLTAYITKMAYFETIAYNRSRKPILSLDSLESPLRIVDELDTDGKKEPISFEYLSKEMPPKTRQVFLMSRQSGLSYKEIAEEMTISIKTVENQMGRALKFLREKFKKNNA